MKKIVFILFFLSSFFDVIAQNTFNFNQLTIKDGLSNGMITCFLQDRTGLIWIGTSDGLNKYDGYQIQVFKHNPQNENSIGGNAIRCLFEDSRNNLWIGLKGGGLSRMNLMTGQFTTFRHNEGSNELSYNDVSGIVEDNDGNLWIAVDRGGLDMFNPNTNTFTHYPLQDQFNKALNNALTGIALDSFHTIWLTSWGGGVYCFDLNKKTFSVHPGWEKQSEDTKFKNIFDIYIDKEGFVWISSSDGNIYSLNAADKTVRQYPVISFIHTFCEDDQNNIWIGTEDGISILNKKDDKITRIISDENSGNRLLSNSINCIYKDNAGSMWIGTNVGVNFYNPLSSQFTWIKKQYNHPLSLSENQVLSILKDRNNNTWVGEVNSLDKINPDGKTITRYPFDKSVKNASLHNFQAICEDSRGIIWFGTYANFLLRYDPAKDSFSRIPIPPPAGMNLSYRNVYAIYEDWDHTLWLSTELGAINYNPSTGVFTPLFQSKDIIYPEEKTHVIYRDQEMELWVGTESGLRRYSRNLELKQVYLSQKNNQNAITNNFITTIHEDSKGVFWIGTMGGLHRFDKKENKFELIKRPDMDYGDPIFGICEDKQGFLWMSATSGILKYNIEGNLSLFHFYDASDGLQDKDFQMGAFFHAKDGELFFGGKAGFNVFYPESLKINDQKPPVLITDFQIFNKPVIPGENGILDKLISETKEVTIKHSQSVISFQFVALNYISSKKNQYLYQMEGYDHDWIPANPGQRSVTYTNLNSGEYTFKVKAANNNGIWNDEPATLKLIIKPPFWGTVYAYLLYVCILGAILYLIFSYFMVRERDKNNLKIAKLEAKRMREMDDMKFNLFTNISHEFRTPLSLILGPLSQLIEKKDYEKKNETLYLLMYRNAQRLLRLINQLLDFRKIEAGKLELNMKYDNIVRFISDLASTFSYYAVEKKIQYTVTSTIPELWMNFDSDKLDKILYNLISNAFQYTSEEGSVGVRISEVIADNKRYIQIEVSDSGIGIAPEEKEQIFTVFYQSKRGKSLREDGSGLGLALTNELVHLHQGKITVESEVNKGSIFRIQLPVNGHEQASEVFSVTDHSSVQSFDDSGIIQTEKNVSADLILIAEDNHDMLLYLENILSGKFKILTAKDGQEALDKALKYIPDLIISDIMMPVLDGIAILKAIKKNEKTNHIPVILLTARHAESSILEGYKFGAEDYITKPFSDEILKIRIENILSSRRKMWEQYKQSKDINEYEEKLVEDPQKQAFLKKINEITMNHIAEQDFNSEKLADELRMSINQLFRKVKALMDTTPHHVIIQIRMTLAARLIEENELNISEIAFAVGYQELSNFSRAFKKYHHLSPREYQKNIFHSNSTTVIPAPPNLTSSS